MSISATIRLTGEAEEPLGPGDNHHGDNNDGQQDDDNDGDNGTGSGF